MRVRDGEVTIRPLAGTRRRGATPEEDKALEKELLADPKERAEHLMLLDLGRNDVGRVAKIGSVRVTESFVIERYSHVMHIVSHVVGELDKRHDVIDALMAGFPAGTLSGAPKVRAMEIIDELEKEKRGPYGGCVGYFSADGEMDSCIVLRTALGQGRRDPRAGGRRHRRRQRSRGRAAGVRVQGPRPVQGRRGGRPLRARGQAGQPLARATQSKLARPVGWATASVGLEADLEFVSGRLCKAAQGPRRRLTPTTFQARNHRLCGVHSLRNLGLGEPSIQARLDDRGHQRKLVIECIIGRAICGISSRLREYLVSGYQPRLSRRSARIPVHVTSFARASAMSISRRGVFCVFFVNTRTMMIRFPLRVT